MLDKQWEEEHDKSMLISFTAGIHINSGKRPAMMTPSTPVNWSQAELSFIFVSSLKGTNWVKIVVRTNSTVAF